MSVPWVKLHAIELGGILTRQGYRFPQDITIERVAEKITVHSTSQGRRFPKGAEREAHEGEIAQKVFALLDKGVPTREIVKELSLPPEKVRHLAQDWIACGQFDATTLAVVHGHREPPKPPPPAPVAMPQPAWMPASSLEPAASRPTSPVVVEAHMKAKKSVAEMVAEARRRETAALNGIEEAREQEETRERETTEDDE